MAANNSNQISPDWLRQYQARTGTTESDSPALRNAYRQHLFRQRQKASPLRNAPPELSEAALTELEAMLGRLSERERVAVERAFRAKVASAVEREAEQEEKRAMAKALLWLEGLEPGELIEHLPPGPETVRALLDWLSPADLEALRNARGMTATVIEEFNQTFAPVPLRNGKEG